MRRLTTLCAALTAAFATAATAQDQPGRPSSSQTPPVDQASVDAYRNLPSSPATRSITSRLTPSVETCSWLVRANGALKKEPATGLDIIRTSSALQRPTVTGQLQGVYCERDSMVPGEWDDRVPLQLGVPLFINGPGGMTTVAIKDRRYQVSFSRGSTMTPLQQEAVRHVVERWEARAAAPG
jgi:hypothetical protein